MARELSRRHFVTYAGGATAFVVVDSSTLRRASAEIGGPLAAPASPVVVRRMVRATDQLDVTLELVDATIEKGKIVRTASGGFARLTFGPQHVAERHYTTTRTIPTIPVPHMAAGVSTVVISLPSSMPATFEALLARAAGSAGVVGQAAAGAPTGKASALELPASLVLSPVSGSRLRAATKTRTVEGVTEVWSAKLENRLASRSAEFLAIHNVTSRDLVARLPDAATRDSIVDNTATSDPLTSSRLWLTSQGAIGNLRGDWPGKTLEAYRHRMTSGRDLHVETVETGFLAPFGHRVSVVTIAHREFTTDGGGGAVAAVRLRRFLEIVDPVVRSNRTGERSSGRGSPFKRITATVDETTPIRLRSISDSTGTIPGVSDLENFDNGDDLMVQFTCVDRDGSTISFSLPATFIEATEAHKTSGAAPVARLRSVANGVSRKSRRAPDLGGQNVAFADPVVPGIGQTSRPTFELELQWDSASSSTTKSQLEDAGSPNVFASIKRADILDSSVSALLGATPSPIGVTLHQRWLDHGNSSGDSANFDLAYLTLETAAVSTIGGDSPVRGVASVELTAEVLNQTAGAGLDLPSASSPWNPADALGVGAAIIGNITLQDVLSVIDFSNAIPGVDIPGVDVEVEDNTITTTFSYTPALTSNSSIGFTARAQSACTVRLIGIVSIDGSTEPEFITEVQLEQFTLSFPPTAPVVDVLFDEVSATMSTSSGLDLDSSVSGVQLHGELEYLSDLFAGVGLSDPRAEVTDTEIDLGITVNLPDISLGVVSIANISLIFGLVIPLDDSAGRLSIDVGTKADPLTIEVLSFGGTFYCGIDVRFGGTGSETNRIAIGVSVYWEILDIDVIIASITVTLRLAADWVLVGDDVVFTGTVSIEGYVSLLGFVEVSLIAALALTYRSVDQQLILKGTIYWAVDTPLGGPDGKVPIGQTSIDLSNSSVRPAGRLSLESVGQQASFGDIHTSVTWADYCDAFA